MLEMQTTGETMIRSLIGGKKKKPKTPLVPPPADIQLMKTSYPEEHEIPELSDDGLLKLLNDIDESITVATNIKNQKSKGCARIVGMSTVKTLRDQVQYEGLIRGIIEGRTQVFGSFKNCLRSIDVDSIRNMHGSPLFLIELKMTGKRADGFLTATSKDGTNYLGYYSDYDDTYRFYELR
jgi:hypothetical protein